MSEREIPKWQADEEATECFLCEEKYNFFHRRHHCRKCGRVVCGDCSGQFLKYFLNTPIVSGPDSRGETLEPNGSYRTCDECAAEVRMVGRVLVGERTDSERAEDRIREEQRKPDEESDDNLCPICASNLLKEYKGPVESDQEKEQFERFKEKHVDDCLHAFDFSRDQSRGNRRSKSQRNKMLVYNMPPIPKPKYETIGNEGSSSVDTTGSQREWKQGERQNNDSGTQERKKPLLTDDEKYGEDECVICLEEMRPGDKVGRLECLCVFHYKCIKDWFNKKGHGECPVHFLAH